MKRFKGSYDFVVLFAFNIQLLYVFLQDGCGKQKNFNNIQSIARKRSVENKYYLSKNAFSKSPNLHPIPGVG